MTSRQLDVTTAGFTHASSVIPVVRCSEAESGIETRALVPLKESASPNLPDVVHVALVIVPVLPFPEASATDVPDPSSNPYAATRFGVLASPGRGKATTAVTATPASR